MPQPSLNHSMKNPAEDSKMDSKKERANRRNAAKSTGPHNTASTRYNAQKHGLLAEGVTEMDDPTTFCELCSRLEAEFAPVGEVEVALVRQVAICIVRLRRARMLEAEFITAELHPPVTETIYPDGNKPAWTEMVERDYGKTVVLDPGLPARLSASNIETLQKFQRYETAIENKLYRALNQLERLQRMRRGDKIPAPATADVIVHHEGALASFGNSTDGIT
jgi:hypothetical protein